MELINYSTFAKNKGIQIVWLDNELGDVQRAFQTIRELLYNDDKDKLGRMLNDFSIHNKAGVEAAMYLIDNGWFEHKEIDDFTAEEVFNELLRKIKQ